MILKNKYNLQQISQNQTIILNAKINFNSMQVQWAERSIADPSETVFQWEMNCATWSRMCGDCALFRIKKRALRPFRRICTRPASGQFNSFVICLIESQSFGNLFCNSQKSFHTSPGPYDSNNRGYESFFKLNNREFPCKGLAAILEV